MKLKGFIEVSMVTEGLDAISVRQLLSVERIDAVVDVRGFTPDDCIKMGLAPQVSTLIVAKSITEDPCEVEETYEQVLALIKEAS